MNYYVKTPLLESLELGQIIGSQVFLKMESVQPSGSFKNRGIGFLCSHYAKDEKAAGFVSASGGNAGLAVAYSGRLLNVPVKVVMPKSSLPLMAEKIKREGAEVIIHGDDISGAQVLALELAQAPGHFFISPFDNPLIWEGHTSIIYEIQETGIKPDAIVLAVGGAGLFCGVVQGLKQIGWDDVTVITAQPEGADSFTRSIKASKLITLDAITTIATSLGARACTPHALTLAKTHPVIPLVVSDKQAVNACLRFADQQRTLVEPACGVALSLIYDRLIDSKKFRKIVVIVCGGCAVTCTLLETWGSKYSH